MTAHGVSMRKTRVQEAVILQCDQIPRVALARVFKACDTLHCRLLRPRRATHDCLAPGWAHSLDTP